LQAENEHLATIQKFLSVLQFQTGSRCDRKLLHPVGSGGDQHPGAGGGAA
jgi:hypothetical protein